MKYEEIINIVKNNKNKNDWIFVEETQSYVFKNDVLISIRKRDDEQNSEFDEEWVHCYPDPKAYRKWYDIIYSGQLLISKLFVELDGFRHFVPCPTIDFNTGNSSFDDLGICIAEICHSETYANDISTAQNYILKTYK
jgi:hypothetical protein